ncbi:hypothetical protein I5Q34_07480 [Streptomyces sp. AV19]|uniref:hypothetical protein n=1 Tax=Streptomyces sp. AV19 TaxID=2793068 RepID=UPI0018FE138C|nr:hypothetical protein [Streptomyces sp. AV19]MBH1934137.1 hypothetical protein [Streptomyces sp. AV19]MDG4537141.1 hypothetical protein [Streptomyces sp. AV19]
MSLYDLVAASADSLHHHTVTLADVPNPGGGEKPPFGDKLLTILKWAAWTVSGACVAGVLGVAGKMALSHRNGEGGEHAKGLAMVMGACIIAGTASGIVGALI